MRQALLQAPGKLELRDVPDLTPGPGELVVRVDVALTCGTDLKTYRRGHPKLPMPTPLGHEYTGVVAAVGEGVTRFRPGDAVVAAPSAPCGACDPCAAGLENLCDRIDGTTMAWGAFAEQIRIPAHVARKNVFLRPPGLAPTEAALLEPLACVVNGVARLDLTRAETVVVLGAGPIGLLFVALLRRQGVPRVLAAGRHAGRLEAALAMGAHEVVDLGADASDPQALARAVRARAPRGACAVVECVGRPEAWLGAIASVRKGGEVLLYGGCAAGTTVPVDAHRLHYDALTLKGAFHFTPADVRVALDLLTRRALPLARLVSAEVPLARLQEALDALCRGEALKLAIVPGSPA
ncbi:MAG: alcohol dehydrogenase catalytic domain-containing protein [Planctomycetes bacterium]|nr:alcohol dehydrogenase catalytic domain-containing protein [Planctomycetota bacterium]